MGDARERLGYVSRRNPWPLFRAGYLCVCPPEMNMQEPNGEYLRRAPMCVRRVSKDEADQDGRGSFASSARQVTTRTRVPATDPYWRNVIVTTTPLISTTFYQY